MLLRYTVFAMLLAAVLVAQAAHAAGSVTPVADILRAAEAALGGNGAQVEARVDSAVRMPACSQPLQGVAMGPRMAEVRCPDAGGWRLTVPARVRRDADVVVLTAPVQAGSTIDAAQLAVQRRDVANGSGVGMSDPSQVAGHVARRALPTGSVVTAGDLADGAGTLKRGDPVVIVSRAGGIEVRMGGRALGGAVAGAVVAVENLESKRIVRGRLVADGVVEVLQ
ncbi:flagellar basal body P-ring formation chaperone FlgA [Cognatilysobacter terrigena]|uniref:flagellar basal body P-ring formation chaperone FlgA n=1 Tax=Cognatilysobacter terrigena TaxID=2488749 RepID=UPI001FE50488|nr:flagellar basal body P-ring formation chaperone FlgA [Lysobacter terrigena]